MKKQDIDILIICKTLPPAIVGSSILLTNLFNEYKGNIIGLSGWEYGIREDRTLKVNFPICSLKFPKLIQRLFEHKFSQIYYLFVLIYINYKIKIIKPKYIFAAATPDGIFFAAAFKAAKHNRIPFIAHMHDLWEENTITWFQKKLARKLEPLVMKESFKIFTMTSTQSLYYLKKYNINTQILPHTIPSCSLHPSPKQKENHKNINILFSGNISPSMNLDALQQFVSIVPLLPENYKVTMLIPLTLQQLKSYNLYHERIHYDWKSSSEARLIQQSSDILFLPLSFKNCSLSEVYTVFATKTLDYLISRTPILIFAPSQSFHAIDAKKKKYALVCDSDNENSLLSQIQILANNKNLRELLVQNALEEATNRSALLWANFLFENLQ